MLHAPIYKIIDEEEDTLPIRICQEGVISQKIREGEEERERERQRERIQLNVGDTKREKRGP